MFLLGDVGLGCLGGGENMCDLELDVVNCCLIEDPELGSNSWMTSQKGLSLGSNGKVKTERRYFVLNCA